METRFDRIVASYAGTRCWKSAALPLGIENRLAAALEYDAPAGKVSLRGIEAAK
jgi:hypothetical protein